MNKLITGSLLLVFTVVFSSCSLLKKGGHRKDNKQVNDSSIVMAPDTARRTTPPPLPGDTLTPPVTPVPPTPPAPKVDSAGITKLLIDSLTPLWRNRLVYRTFSGKAKVHFEGPDNNLDFTAHFRVRKDSVIWINVTALGGIQFARILITPDSFFMINTTQKEATALPLSAAAKVLPSKVDFTSLQNLVLGEPLREGTITNASAVENAWILVVEDSSYIQHLTYGRKDSLLSAGQLQTHDPKGPQAMLNYDSYEAVEQRKVSNNRVLLLLKGTDSYNLEMNFQKTEFDQPLEFPFSIPKSYTIKH